MKTPMSSDTKLTKDKECESVDSTKYRGMIGTAHLGLWYPKGTGIETIVYADSDHAGDYVDRKSTSESEYVSAGKACQQALWMKQALIDYDIRLDDVPIMCDNKGVIDLSKNPVQHSRTKHIEIRHHFLHDNVQKGHISFEKVPSIDNITDIRTKALKRESFNYLQSRDAIFDEDRFSSIPRPKDIIPNSVESQRDDHSDDVPIKGLRDQVGSQYFYCYSIEEDPITYNEAMQSRDAAFWKEEINDKIGSIMENNAWVLSDLPPGCKPLGCKWIFKRKMKVDGTIDKFKA
ncbi:hypothetical protein Tco_0356946 [Tanacetum coccineum]